MNKKEISVLLALIVTVALSVCAGSIHTADRVKANTLRLHIIANSDTSADQQIKLAVKEQLLKMDALLPDNSMNFVQATVQIQNNIPAIEEKINYYLAQNNLPYKAECSLEQFYFDTTQYTGFALPQGEYTALTVRLGRAAGKNWWCVIYPQLCSQSCGDIALENSDGFIKTQKITPRFKVVELYEDIKGIFAQREKEYTSIC